MINEATLLDAGPLKPSDSLSSCASLCCSPQMKSCSSLLGVSFGSWPSGMMSPALPLCSSPSAMLANSLEGNTAASVSSKSESPVPRMDKISATLEMPKSLDHPSPQPIPEGECLIGRGWRWAAASHSETPEQLIFSGNTKRTSSLDVCNTHPKISCQFGPNCCSGLCILWSVAAAAGRELFPPAASISRKHVDLSGCFGDVGPRTSAACVLFCDAGSDCTV